MVRILAGQSTWVCMKCYDEVHHGEYPFQFTFPQAAQFATIVTGVDWNDLGDSEVLTQLKNSVGEGNLALRVTMSYFTRHYEFYKALNATFGYLIGVIGVADPSDSLSVPGERTMYSKGTPLRLKFDSGDLCYGMNLSRFDPWLNVAYFEVDTVRHEIRLDLSNSLPSDIFNSVRDIGILRLGILMKSCVYLLGEDSGIPYVMLVVFLQFLYTLQSCTQSPTTLWCWYRCWMVVRELVLFVVRACLHWESHRVFTFCFRRHPTTSVQ